MCAKLQKSRLGRSLNHQQNFYQKLFAANKRLCIFAAGYPKPNITIFKNNKDIKSCQKGRTAHRNEKEGTSTGSWIGCHRPMAARFWRAVVQRAVTNLPFLANHDTKNNAIRNPNIKGVTISVSPFFISCSQRLQGFFLEPFPAFTFIFFYRRKGGKKRIPAQSRLGLSANENIFSHQ